MVLRPAGFTTRAASAKETTQLKRILLHSATTPKENTPKDDEPKIENILNLQKGDTVCERALQLISSERLDNEIAFNPEVTFDVDHLHARVRFSGMPSAIQFSSASIASTKR